MACLLLLFKGLTDGRTNGWTDGRMNGRTVRRTDRRTDGWTDGRTNVRTYVVNFTERPGSPHDCLFTEEFSQITAKLLMYLPSFPSLNFLNVNVFAITIKLGNKNCAIYVHC